ncbi:hypothetical protein M501DRAFT_997149 [Patellaria atrata CBS 101060]|uniref:NADH-ubiquinone oxidoreductase 17.8 kDa subunit n=1 Tax=Patellaria atrata CBS 101060 TaxID=1346257 RepID=A0A9P4VKH5_9PEZI|nr:hypothetical protein M501DRAFT_997149 [Patellaria atrata CBS 101060]
MQSTRRAAVATARTARLFLRVQPRRYAQHDAHHHAEPVNETFGLGFYVGLATIPAFAVVYTLSRPLADGGDRWFTAWVRSYNHWGETWAKRNDLHVQALERAGADRNLFLNERPSDHHELRFPETFNMSCPWNVPAGHIPNIDKVIAHYQKRNWEEQEEKLRALKENRLPAEQVPKRVGKLPPNP